MILNTKTISARWASLHINKTKFPLVLFNQELISLLEAGLSIVVALETLFDKEKNTEIKAILFKLLSSLREGKPLSIALSHAPQNFPVLYVATIKASERTGNLLESLKRYLTYQQQVEIIRRKVISASIYPILLLSVGSLVVLFLMTYVIPKFSHIYSDAGKQMPFASKVLVLWGQFIELHGSAVFVGLIFLLILIIYGFYSPAVRSWVRELMWNVPVIGDRMRLYQLTRFYRTLGMLTNAGIPVMAALEQVGGLLDVRLRKRLNATKNLVREGLPLSIAVERNELSTPVASRLLRVGEEAGQIGIMMDKIADFHEEELSRWIDIATRLLEPVLMTFMGLLIGGIVVLMYIPIIDLAGSVQ